MRKLFIPIVVIALFLTSCKSIIPQKPNLDTSFYCDFELNAFPDDRNAEMNISGNMTRYGMGIWEMNITAPETMDGVSVRYREGDVSASLGELSFDIPAEKLPESAMFKQIFDAFDACAASHDPELYSDGENAVYKAPAGFSIAFEKTNMQPVLLTLPDDITVKIISYEKELSSDTTMGTADENQADLTQIT